MLQRLIVTLVLVTSRREAGLNCQPMVSPPASVDCCNFMLVASKLCFLVFSVRLNFNVI